MLERTDGSRVRLTEAEGDVEEGDDIRPSGAKRRAAEVRGCRQLRLPLRRILVAAEGSAAGEAALWAGITLARSTGAWATLACVRGEPPPLEGGLRDELALTRELRRARAIIEQASAQAAAVGVEAESEILAGEPVSALVELADARLADLIVVGSSDVGPAPQLDAVATGVLRSAHCPVLVVKPPLERGRRTRAPRAGRRASPFARGPV